jgi:hypothetical protein
MFCIVDQSKASSNSKEILKSFGNSMKSTAGGMNRQVELRFSVTVMMNMALSMLIYADTVNKVAGGLRFYLEVLREVLHCRLIKSFQHL